MAGKGSRRRPTKVPTAVSDANYEAIFGKFVPLYLRKKLPDTPTELDKKDNNDIQQSQNPQG
jgi:hypothetical protein